MPRRIIIPFYILIAVIVISGCTDKNPDAPVLPMEDFFREPDALMYSISPNGKNIAYVSPAGNKSSIKVFDSDGYGDTVSITEDFDGKVIDYFWSGNGTIVYLYTPPQSGFSELYAVDLERNQTGKLSPDKDVKIYIVDQLPTRDDEVIVKMNLRKPDLFDVYKINIQTGSMEMIAKNPGKVNEWITDNNGVVRIGITTDGVNMGCLYRDNENEDFELIKITDFREIFNPLFFANDNQTIFAASNIGRDRIAIVCYDIKNDKEIETLYEHHEVGVYDLIRSPDRRGFVGVSFITWKKEFDYFNEVYKKMQEDLEARLGKNKEVVFSQVSDNERNVLVRTYSDKSLGAYYYYNRKSGRLRKLGESGPWLNEKYMSEMKPVTFKSRDGINIHGYLSIPVGVSAKNLPVVVRVRGVTWSRDFWGFDREVQFLTNRGYAVFQVNFRGSTGYGQDFWEAGFKQWGQKMQDDVTDGVNWLIDQEIADPDRIAICGNSYGGYSALIGAAKEPDVYACAASNSGIVNITTYLNTIPDSWTSYKSIFYEMVGNPQKDSVMLRENSPLYKTEDIITPLFISEAKNNPRNNRREVDEFIKKVRANGTPVEFYENDGNGMYFRDNEEKFKFYRRLETFFAKYLGGRTEKTPVRNN